MMKRIVLLAAMLAMMALLAAPALAQDPLEGPGVETGTDHANSICSFSGLNDHDPLEPPGGRTQSYGRKSSAAISIRAWSSRGRRVPAPSATRTSSRTPRPFLQKDRKN